jgi:hypothetical protein
MPHIPDRAARFVTRGPGFAVFLLAGAPLMMQAQVQGTVRVEATVVSAEASLAWQAVASRLRPSVGPAPAASAATATTLATIDDRIIYASGDPLARRRVLTVEYLRN